jgi:hypothetical protein
MPVLPKWFIRTQLGDKIPHFLAYLGLVFLWWFAISPYKRVHWLRPQVWITICTMAIYGTLDEWLQGFVNRSPDVWDFAADMAGVLSGLALLTFFDFWAAAIIVGCGVIFGAAVLVQTDLVAVMPVSGAVFYLVGYALVTGCWVCYLSRRYRLEPPQQRWLPLALLLPLVLLAVVHGCAALVLGRTRLAAPLAGLMGIVVVAATAWFSGHLRKGRRAAA